MDPAWLAAIGDFNFLYASGVLLLVSVVVITAVSLLTAPPAPEKLEGLTYAMLDKREIRASVKPFDIGLTALTISLVLGMYLYFSFWL
jgi:solute:Na+ symporter, SSS family